MLPFVFCISQSGVGKYYIVRLSASFQKIARFVGRIAPGPRFVANRADVMFTHTPRSLLATDKLQYVIT